MSSLCYICKSLCSDLSCLCDKLFSKASSPSVVVNIDNQEIPLCKNCYHNFQSQKNMFKLLLQELRDDHEDIAMLLRRNIRDHRNQISEHYHHESPRHINE
jgi:ribosome-binding protein aMBF1 (putative translation factor)